MVLNEVSLFGPPGSLWTIISRMYGCTLLNVMIIRDHVPEEVQPRLVEAVVYGHFSMYAQWVGATYRLVTGEEPPCICGKCDT